MAFGQVFGRAEFVRELKALGINVSRETLPRLETYAALLTKWQAKINLIGPATLPDLWRRHFLDSAQLIALLDAPLPPLRGKVGMGGDAAQGSIREVGAEMRALRRGPPHPAPAKLASLAKPPQPSPARGEGEPVAGRGGTLVDLGSGAGFPGLVLAIMTDWRVHLLDSDQRKCAFLRQVALDCGVLDRVTIHAKRIEQVAGIAADVVTARACAPLEVLLRLAAPLVGENGTCLFLKGAAVEEELTAAERHWTMRLDRRASVSDPSGSILIVTQLGRKT
jgi:16S rRNA (guanine(527)-N(7))-methyltransferase RsmG